MSDPFDTITFKSLISADSFASKARLHCEKMTDGCRAEWRRKYICFATFAEDEVGGKLSFFIRDGMEGLPSFSDSFSSCSVFAKG